MGSTPKEAWNGSYGDDKAEYKKSYRKSYGNQGTRVENFKIGDRILYHHPVEKKNKLSADYNYSGIVTKTNFGSVEIKLTDGRTITSALKNVKRLL